MLYQTMGMSNIAGSLSSRRYTFWVLAGMAFLAPLIWSMLKRLEMANNVETWLPRDDSDARILAWSQEHFEPEDRFLVTWESNSLADPRVSLFAARLREQIDSPDESDPYIATVAKAVTPHEVLSAMVERGVSKKDAVDRLTGILVGSGLLKVRLHQDALDQVDDVQSRLQKFAGDELDIELEFRPALDGPGVLGRGQSADASNETDEEEAEDGYQTSDWTCPAHDFQIQWRGISPQSEASTKLITFARRLGSEQPIVEDCFFQAGSPVAVSVSIMEDANAHLPETIASVRQVAVDVGIPIEELRMGGSPVARAALNREAARAGWNTNYSLTQFHKRSPLILSAIVGTFLAFFMLRSMRLALLVLLTAGYTALSIVALVPATGHTLNTVLIVMPNLLLVLTMSGAIHLANYWRYAANAGASDPVATAVRMASEPCTMASVTTAIGLASLLTSVLLPVKEFGAYSAVGCLFSLLMVLVGFPALLRVWPGRPAPMHPPERDVWTRFGRWLGRHGTPVAFGCLALFAISIYGLKWFRTETKVIQYFPDNMRIVEDYNYLEDNLAGIVSLDVIVQFERAEDGDLATPEDIFGRMNIVRNVQSAVETVPGVSGGLSLADFRNASSDQPPKSRSDRLRYNRRVRLAEYQIFGTQSESAGEFVRLAQSRLAVEKDGIPFSIEPTTDDRDGDEVWRIRVQSGVMTDVRYEDLLADIDTALTTELKGVEGVNHVVTGMVPLFLRTQEAVLDSLIRSFAIAFGVIAIVMIVLLRSVMAGLITMLPNLLPVGVVFGAISWYGIPVDIGTMITASVALGIAVDGTLHLLTWFRDGVKRGLSRSEAIAQGLSHCGPAMWQTSTAIALGLLMLAFADLLLISRFGWLMAALIGAALIADVVYLPALLSGVLGRLIEQSIPMEGDVTISSTEVPAESEVSLSP